MSVDIRELLASLAREVERTAAATAPDPEAEVLALAARVRSHRRRRMFVLRRAATPG